MQLKCSKNAVKNAVKQSQNKSNTKWHANQIQSGMEISKQIQSE